MEAFDDPAGPRSLPAALAGPTADRLISRPDIVVRKTVSQARSISVSELLAKVWKHTWARFWMQFAGTSWTGRFASRAAALFSPPYKGRRYLVELGPRGYVSPRAVIRHDHLELKGRVFLDDGVVIYQSGRGGAVKLGPHVHIHRDTIIETGQGGNLTIGEHTYIQPRCQFSAYLGSIRIGRRVQIAPNCAFYPYNHGLLPHQPIHEQPLHSKGGIVIDDEAWLGFGVIVMDGVRIGKGAVVGAGAVVTHDIPDGAVAVGVPARVLGTRETIGARVMGTGPEQALGEKP